MLEMLEKVILAGYLLAGSWCDIRKRAATFGFGRSARFRGYSFQGMGKWQGDGVAPRNPAGIAVKGNKGNWCGRRYRIVLCGGYKQK